MASEDLGYWTFRGSDIRALLFYLSEDVPGLRTVRECQRERSEKRGRGRREKEIREKRSRGEAQKEMK